MKKTFKLVLISFVLLIGLFAIVNCQKNTQITNDHKKISIYKDGTTSLNVEQLNTQASKWMNLINSERSNAGLYPYTSLIVISDSLVQSRGDSLFYIVTTKITVNDVTYRPTIGLIIINNGNNPDLWVGNVLVVCDCDGGGCIVEWYEHNFHCDLPFSCHNPCKIYAWVNGRPPNTK